jgi:ABC-type transport system involved in cytochrome bd biosynthesis fused ATPase/permease subunit
MNEWMSDSNQREWNFEMRVLIVFFSSLSLSFCFFLSFFYLFLFLILLPLLSSSPSIFVDPQMGSRKNMKIYRIWLLHEHVQFAAFNESQLKFSNNNVNFFERCEQTDREQKKCNLSMNKLKRTLQWIVQSRREVWNSHSMTTSISCVWFERDCLKWGLTPECQPHLSHHHFPSKW